MTELIEYRVRMVPRFIVTRFERTGDEQAEPRKCRGTSSNGEFDNYETAYEVAYALCKAEHDRLGWDMCDERIQYPRHEVRLEAASRGVFVTPTVAKQRSKHSATKAKA